jgi:hypothetical protein
MQDDHPRGAEMREEFIRFLGIISRLLKNPEGRAAAAGEI